MRRLFCRTSAVLVFIGLTLFVSRADAQASPPAGAHGVTPPVEPGVVRELLRKIQEQQKRLDEEQKSLATLIRELEALP